MNDVFEDYLSFLRVIKKYDLFLLTNQSFSCYNIPIFIDFDFSQVIKM